MAGLRVFVSSTCYDLSLLRSQIRLFIQSLGYEPIMSDYEDVLYDPRKHTQMKSIEEILMLKFYLFWNNFRLNI